MTIQEPDRADSPASAPTPQTCALIVDIWTQVLAKDNPVGADDNFFALGGDSIEVLNVAFRLHQLFGVEMSPAVVFDAPTPRLLSKWLDGELLYLQACVEPVWAALERDEADSGII